MNRILLAAALVLAGFTADAQSRTVCIVGADGIKRCYEVNDSPGLLARMTFRPQPRRVASMPTTAPAPCEALREPGGRLHAQEVYEEHSIVTRSHAGPFVRNGRWYPGKLAIRATARAGKAVARVWYPSKYARKAVRGVRSRACSRR